MISAARSLGAEPVQPGPQTVVGRERRLGLQPDQVLDGLHHRAARARRQPRAAAGRSSSSCRLSRARLIARRLSTAGRPAAGVFETGVFERATVSKPGPQAARPWPNARQYGADGYSLAMSQEASPGPANAASRGPGRPPRKQPARPSLGGGAPAQDRELRAQGRETVRRLLEAGMVEFEDRGFHGVRVDDVVRRAGISHGTFYLYFSNKEDLFKALLKDALHDMEIVAGDFPVVTSDDTGLNVLRQWVREVLPGLRGARHRDPHPQPGRPGARGGVRRRPAAVLQHRGGHDDRHDGRRPGRRAGTRSTPSSPRWPA